MYVCMYVCMYVYIYAAVSNGNVSQAIILNPFTICLSYKREFVVFPFLSEQKLSIANGLYRHAHLCYAFSTHVNVTYRYIIRIIEILIGFKISLAAFSDHLLVFPVRVKSVKLHVSLNIVSARRC